jgi:peroxiredoxin
LQAYQRALPEIESLGASLIAISPELPDNSLSTAEKNALSFPVLSDVGNGVARSYRLAIRMPDVIEPVFTRFGFPLTKWNGDDSWELPMPATFVIDRDRSVLLAYVDADYTTRLEPKAILDRLRSL